MMWTESPDVETCDLRLTTIDANSSLPTTKVSAYPTPPASPTPPVSPTPPKTPSTTPSTPTPPPAPPTPKGPYLGNFTKVDWTDVAFFRFGYYQYQKMNLVSMVNNFTSGQWYKVDLLLDWTNNAVTVYVNETQLASDIFFTKSTINVNSTNAIVLYNLTPDSQCRVKKLQVC